MKDLIFEDDGVKLVITDEVTNDAMVVSIYLYHDRCFVSGMAFTLAEATRVAEKLLRFARKATA